MNCTCYGTGGGGEITRASLVGGGLAEELAGSVASKREHGLSSAFVPKPFN